MLIDWSAIYWCWQSVCNTKHSAISNKPRNAFRGQSRSPNMSPFHMIGMVVSYSNFVRWDIRLQKCCELENQVKGSRRSLKMSPFDGGFITSYWCSMALAHVVYEIFNIEEYRDLEIPSRANQGHRQWYHSIGYSFLLVFYSNFVPKMHRFWDIRLQKCRDLDNRVMGPSRWLKMSPFDRGHVTSN